MHRYPLDVSATLLQLLPTDYPTLVACSLDMLQRLSNNYEKLVTALGKVQMLVHAESEQLFRRLSVMTNLLRERVERSEDWLGMARRVDRENAGQVEYILTLAADMCFCQFGKPGQGHYTPSVGGDLGSDTRTGPNKRPRRRVSSSSGASALASQDGDAKQAPEDSDDEDHQASVQRAQARLVAHIRDPQVRRWAAVLGPRWRATSMVCDTIDKERQTMLRHLGLLPLVMALLKDIEEAWSIRANVDAVTGEFARGVRRVMRACFVLLEVMVDSHTDNQEAIQVYIPTIREYVERGWARGSLLAAALRGNAPLCRGVSPTALGVTVGLIKTHGRRPHLLAPIAACVAPGEHLIPEMQSMGLQLLLEQMESTMFLVYDRTNYDIRHIWQTCTREVLAVVLKDLYHNREFGVPWYDEWVGQFLPDTSSTNAASSERTLPPMVDPAHDMEDIYVPEAGARDYDSDGSASTVDWDAMSQARDLLYHIRLMELLCVCTAGQVSMSLSAIAHPWTVLTRWMCGCAEPQHRSEVPGVAAV